MTSLKTKNEINKTQILSNRLLKNQKTLSGNKIIKKLNSITVEYL